MLQPNYFKLRVNYTPDILQLHILSDRKYFPQSWNKKIKAITLEKKNSQSNIERGKWGSTVIGLKELTGAVKKGQIAQ